MTKKQPEYAGKWWAIHNSDCIEGMHAMPEHSVDCMVTSIPFGDLFTYSSSERDLGNAGEGRAFMDQYRFFAEALTRVMKPGRIACIHVTDLPTRKGKHGYIGLPDYVLFFRAPGENPDRIEHVAPSTAPTKEIIGWEDADMSILLYGKSDFVEGTQRPDDGRNWQPVYKEVRFASKEAVELARKWLHEMHRQGLASETPTDEQIEALLPHCEFDVYEWQKLASPVWMNIQQGNVLNGWRGAKAENDEKHVCPLQLDVIENCLRLYSKPGDVVMDPFNGIGSTGYVAVKMFRRYLGFELKPEYAEMADRNLKEAEASMGGLFGDAA